MEKTSGKVITNYQARAKINRRARLTVEDTYLGTEQRLERWGYCPSRCDVEEFVASIFDMYLNSAGKGINRAVVDMATARLCFIWYNESTHAPLHTNLHIETLVNFITSDLYMQLKYIQAGRIKDYTISGYLLSILV